MDIKRPKTWSEWSAEFNPNNVDVTTINPNKNPLNSSGERVNGHTKQMIDFYINHGRNRLFDTMLDETAWPSFVYLNVERK
jgi:CRISPR/Cas system type I-B associated protein Csh2 (Cas7 group RAMP superfamily)